MRKLMLIILSALSFQATAGIKLSKPAAPVTAPTVVPSSVPASAVAVSAPEPITKPEVTPEAKTEKTSKASVPTGEKKVKQAASKRTKSAIRNTTQYKEQVTYLKAGATIWGQH